jgi:hypothetical protein
MKKMLAPLIFATALGLCAGASAPAFAVDTCPNAALRTGPSAALPDCRAYELVSTDINHASLGNEPSGHAAEDGNTVLYQTIDAPLHAHSASPFNAVRSARDAVKGWSGMSLSPPITAPTTAFNGALTWGISLDLSSTFEFTDQPLSGGAVPPGLNSFVRRSDGTYRLLTTVGTAFIPGLDVYAAPIFDWGNEDFSNVYFQPMAPQLPIDPSALFGGSLYASSEENGLSLVGILPDGTAAPNGAGLTQGVLQPASEDGKYVVFIAEGRIYLRIEGAPTLELGVSQRTINPDPNPPPAPANARITGDGKTILLTSRAELTNDANTGESGGIANDAGMDLYSYDTATGHLTDLTVDTNPEDAATGANVQNVLGATRDAGYVYFTARGVLASGASPGHSSLYVWHENHIDFVANADDIPGIILTPNGRHFAFGSTASFTGYDNTDPATGKPHVEVFEGSLGSPIECVSCRPDGSRPTADSSLPGYQGLPPGPRLRVISDDGSRVFFQSPDAILPQALNGREKVWEYSDGKVTAISPVEASSSASFLDASGSGDDVFFTMYDELVPNPNGGDNAVYDARVDGGFPIASSDSCSGIACQASATPPPALPIDASLAFVGEGNVRDTSSGSKAASNVTLSKRKRITGTAGVLRVRVSGKGRITVSGSGLRTKRLSPPTAQTISVRVSLTGKAIRALRKDGFFNTKVKVAFVDSAGKKSTASLSLTFKSGSARKGR